MNYMDSNQAFDNDMNMTDGFECFDNCSSVMQFNESLINLNASDGAISNEQILEETFNIKVQDDDFSISDIFEEGISLNISAETLEKLYSK